MKKLPIVALIGQTNAGKSSLLNRLAHQNIAIVAREEGTTRDNVVATIDNSFILVDTAGLKDPTDDFEASIQDQIADAIDAADLILVTLDSTKLPDQKDREIQKQALRSKKPVLVVLNKTDLKESLPTPDLTLFSLPENHIIRTSATTGQGINNLKSAIYQALPDTKPRKSEANTTALKLALIGRPNVGKSSLFNALGKKQQAIVSNRQGTTRDINRVKINYNKQPIEILDTAGLRKPGKREVGIEKFSAIRTLAAIEESDICALLIDATEPRSKLDQSLAGEIVKAGKGIILVVTKIDTLNSATTQQEDKTSENVSASPAYSPTDTLLKNLQRDFNFIPYAPVLLTSSETGKNVTKLFDLLETVDASRHQELKTSDLNKILSDAITNHPPAGLKNTHPKPKYLVQTDTCPPWFVLHGHDLGLLHWSWKRYLERKIREIEPFIGTPICFSFITDNPKKPYRKPKNERK